MVTLLRKCTCKFLQVFRLLLLVKYVVFVKSLYGLCQVPCNWVAKLAGALKSFGFDQSYAAYSLFTFTRHDISIHVLVYVDDLIIARNNTTVIFASLFKLLFSHEGFGCS